VSVLTSIAYCCTLCRARGPVVGLVPVPPSERERVASALADAGWVTLPSKIDLYDVRICPACVEQACQAIGLERVSQAVERMVNEMAEARRDA
jgi:hypothetical protein